MTTVDMKRLPKGPNVPAPFPWWGGGGMEATGNGSRGKVRRQEVIIANGNCLEPSA